MYYFEIGTLVLFVLISVKDIFHIRHFASKGGSPELAALAFHFLGWASIGLVILLPMNYLNLFWLFPLSLILGMVFCLFPFTARSFDILGSILFIGINHERRLFRQVRMDELRSMFVDICCRSGEELGNSGQLAAEAELRWIHLTDDELDNIHGLYSLASKKLRESPGLSGEEALTEAVQERKSISSNEDQ